MCLLLDLELFFHCFNVCEFICHHCGREIAKNEDCGHNKNCWLLHYPSAPAPWPTRAPLASGRCTHPANCGGPAYSPAPGSYPQRLARLLYSAGGPTGASAGCVRRSICQNVAGCVKCPENGLARFGWGCHHVHETRAGVEPVSDGLQTYSRIPSCYLPRLPMPTLIPVGESNFEY